MAMSIPWMLAAATAASTGTALVEGNQSKQAAKGAAYQAQQAAAKTLQQQTEATNRANAQSPNVNALITANQNAARSGGSSTMLTGPGGVPNSALSLGKNSLLGS